MKMNRYKSIVDIELMEHFQSQYPKKSFFNYVSNLVGLEGFISVAGVLMPEIIEVEGCIFLSENYPMLKEQLKTRFGDDKKTLERYTNLLNLSEFYLMAADDLSLDESWQFKHGEIIKAFWEKYLNYLFPQIEFEFELTKNGLFDEHGVCLTFSQK
jgi:hypothetical protein